MRLVCKDMSMTTQLIQWASAPNLVGLPGMPTSHSGVLRQAQAKCWQTRPRAGRGRPGLEYRVADLPAETQQALAGVDPALAESALVHVRQAHAASQRQQAASRRADAVAAHGVVLEATGGLDPASNPKLDVFQRFEIYHRARGSSAWTAMQEFVALYNRGDVEVHAHTRAAFAQLTAKTLDKWYRCWRVDGVTALLARKPRSDKGKTALAGDEQLHGAFLAAVAEMHDPTARQVHRVLEQQVGKSAAPSISTVRRWLADFKVDHAAALLKFKNPDGWRNKYMVAFGSQSDNINRPNQQWQLDSTIGDAQQRAEIAFNITDMETGEIRRHAIIAGIDVFTRRAAVVVARTSNSNAVKTLMRQAIRDWGKPEQVKTDNGKDYTAKDFDFALTSLGIEHLLCTPFSPDQKPYIERFIGTLMHDLFPMLTGFVGHSVAERKAIDSGLSFAQRFGHGGVDLRMDVEQLRRVIAGWLDEYHNRVHSELRCTPNEMAARHVTHVVRLDDRALDLFLMRVAGNARRNNNKKGIRFDNGRFAAPELAAYVGQEVLCRQDEADLGALHVFALDGRYICRALDHSQLGINKAELAAKARAIESATIKPMVDRLRAAKRKGLTRQAVNAIYAEREAQQASASGNVHQLAPRQVQASTPQIDAVVAHHDTSAADAVRASARATLDSAPALPAAPRAEVKPLQTPNDRYSRWVRLQARVARTEPVPERDLDWLRSYASSSEFAAWHALHEGTDPLADEATG